MSDGIWANWPENILRPILVNVLTAAALFGAALIFKPQIYDLLAPPGIPEYPLACYAEPRSGNAADERRVEFYVVNLKQQRLDHADLQSILTDFGPSDRLLTPGIRLAMKDSMRGRIVSAVTDTPFNADKSDIDTEIGPEGRSVHLRIKWIEEWAIVRVDLRFAGMRELEASVHRMAKNLVPVEYRHLQPGCFEG